MTAPVMLIRAPTRERIGGTTFLRYVYGRALNEGRDCDAADFDRRGQVFRTFFKRHAKADAFYRQGMKSGAWETCMVPTSGETAHLKADITACVNGIAEAQRSLVVDFAGSEGAVMEYARDNSLTDVCELAGVRLTVVAMVGPGAQDIATVMRLVKSKMFQPHELLLVCNGGLVREGEDFLAAYGKFLVAPGAGEERDPDIIALIDDGARVMAMPRFDYVADVEAARADFFTAAERSNATLGVVQRINAGIWLYGNVKGERIIKAGMAQMVDVSGAKDALP